MENTDEVVQEAVDKLVGLKTYSVQTRVMGYYNLVVEARNEDEAWTVAVLHSHTWEDLSYQGDVEIDQIEEIKND